MSDKLKISGIAVSEQTSRNKRKYLAKELEKFAPTLIGRPILKDHAGTTDNVIGKITNANFNSIDKSVSYEGWVKEDGSGILERIKDGRISEVSIGAIAGKVVKESKDSDILIPIDMEALELSTTPIPGNRGTSLGFESINYTEEQLKEIINNFEEAQVTAMEKKRKQLGLSVSQFYAAPRDPPSSSALPIFDAPHVRNAMARFNQTHFNSPEEKAKAKRAILRAARKFNIDTTNFKESQSSDTFESNKKEDKESMESTTENTVENNYEVEVAKLKEELEAIKAEKESLEKEKAEYLESQRLAAIKNYKKLCETKGVKAKDLSEATMDKIEFATELVESLPDLKEETVEAEEAPAEKPEKEEAEEEPAKEEEKPVAEPQSKEPEEAEEESNESYDGLVITTEDVSGRGVALYKYY